MIIKDPWGDKHRVNDRYDNSDIDISTSHVFNELTPTDLLTRAGYNWNRTSTRVNESRDVTLKINGPMYKENGLRINKKMKNW